MVPQLRRLADHRGYAWSPGNEVSWTSVRRLEDTSHV